MSTLTTVVLGMGLTGALWVSAASAAEVPEELKQAEQEWAALFNAKDAPGLAGRYTEDGMRLPPDATWVVGREAVQAHLQGELDAGLTNIKLEPSEGGSEGNLGWVVGEFMVDYPTEGGETGTATGTYSVVYRKEADGVWRLAVDTWNDAPSE